MDPFGAAEDAPGRADQLVGPVPDLLEPLPDLLDPVLQPVGRVPSSSKHGSGRQRPAHVVGSQAKALAAGLLPSPTAISVSAAILHHANDNDTQSVAHLATFDQAMAKLHHDVAELVPDS
jgi:hypothetical protein